MERCTDNTEFIEKLREFLFWAQLHRYGSGEEPAELADGGKTLNYKNRDWECIDTWYDGEQFSGITKILYQGKVVWTMVYRGEVRPGFNKDYVHRVLRTALMSLKAAYPWRGPEEFVDKSGLIYQNQWEGNICHFKGEESINFENKESFQDSPGQIFFSANLYSASYLGGFVNLR